MIMQASTAPVQFDGNSSMSSFMSGLLKERAIQCSLANSNWNIQIVDDNARPKHIDKRKLGMTRQKESQSCRDLRWGGDSSTSMKSFSREPPVSRRRSMDNSGPPVRASRSGLGNVNRTQRIGSLMDFKKFADGNSRFESTCKSSSNASLPSVSGLRRSAASDTMLLKMPVRVKSPGSFHKRSSVDSINSANAMWGSQAANPVAKTPIAEAMMTIKKMPRLDMSSDDSIASLSIENEWLSCSSSNASSMSRLSSSKIAHSSNSIHSSLSRNNSSFSNNKKERTSNKNKTMKKSKSGNSRDNLQNRTSSSDSLKQRASLLGLNLK